MPRQFEESKAVELADRKLLLESALRDAERSLSISRPGSEGEASARAALDELRARWEAETEAREVRAALKAVGLSRSQYRDREWVRRSRTGRWERYATAQAVRLAGITLP